MPDGYAGRIGYCTNVHPGRTIEETRAQLEEHAVGVRHHLADDAPLDVGLWLSAPSIDDEAGARSILNGLPLRAMTFNAFPYGDFHAERVKHAVYRPDWTTCERFDYTRRVARLAQTLSARTLSTLPLGWGPTIDDDAANACAGMLVRLAKRFENDSDPVMICLEPEPGCALDTADDVIRFFERHLLPAAETEGIDIRRHVGVCHDVCHSAVMREPQRDAIDAYVASGIEIGKVQVSSAMVFDFTRAVDHALAAPFAEDRYLHQTTIDTGSDRAFVEDLPAALAESRTGRWYVHYHVPIFLDEIETPNGVIGTTRHEIIECLDALRTHALEPDLEVETYTWNILPSDLRPATLAEGIAREVSWLRHLLEDRSA